MGSIFPILVVSLSPGQVFQVQPSSEHRQLSVRRAWPLGFRPIPVEFDPIVVGIAQVQGFADAVIARAVEPDSGCQEPAQRDSRAARARPGCRGDGSASRRRR